MTPARPARACASPGKCDVVQTLPKPQRATFGSFWCSFTGTSCLPSELLLRFQHGLGGLVSVAATLRQVCGGNFHFSQRLAT